jgi:hypothetical protein
MGQIEFTPTWIIYGGLFVALVVAVLLFFRWSQHNIKANTQRIKQQLAEEAASPPIIDMPPGTPRGDGDADEVARDMIAPMEERLLKVEERLARLEQLVQRPAPPTAR